MLDEPTRGIDIAAKVDIYELIGRMAAEGKAVLIISSELPELFGITDRILVMRRGRLIADLVTSETTQEAVMQLKWSGPGAPVSALSGGNQQKLLLGRALIAQSRLWVLDEPTRGIDIARQGRYLRAHRTDGR